MAKRKKKNETAENPEMQLSAKLKLILDDGQKMALDSSMIAFRDACNLVSEYIYWTGELVEQEVRDAVYRPIRHMFGLPSQMAQSVIRTVIGAYKTMQEAGEWNEAKFTAPQLGLTWGRSYSYKNGVFSIGTLKGRIKGVRFNIKGMEHFFNPDIYRFNGARIVCANGDYFLHAAMGWRHDIAERQEIVNITGIDRGIRFIITTYNSKGKCSFRNGGFIKSKRAGYKRLRQELQKRGTPSARRRLKLVGNRENRWMRDVNHCASKALVSSNPQNTLFVLEDLTGIRGRTERVRTKDRYVSVSWAYYDLELKLIYKAMSAGQAVVKADPAYTSQRCPICGHVAANNRNKEQHHFKCRQCGYQSNDDRIGAMNLYLLGCDYLAGIKPTENAVTEQPHKKRGGSGEKASGSVARGEKEKPFCFNLKGFSSTVPRCDATSGHRLVKVGDSLRARAPVTCTTGQSQTSSEKTVAQAPHFRAG